VDKFHHLNAFKICYQNNGSLHSKLAELSMKRP